MEEMKVQPEEREIDLLEVFCVLWYRAWILLLSLVVGAVLAGVVTYLTEVVPNTPDPSAAPVYEAYSSIFTVSANDDAESYLMELEISSSLVTDFQILGRTREVVEAAMAACGIERQYENVVASISISILTPHMIRVHMRDEDPQLAAQFCNALADQLKLKVAEVMGIDVPATASRAAVPTVPLTSGSSGTTNLTRNCMFGGGVFLALAAVAVLLVHFVGDSFKEKMAVFRSKERNHK